MAETKHKTPSASRAPKHPAEPVHTDTLNRAEELYKRHTNLINGIGLVIILVIGGFFAYKYVYQAPRESKAENMVFMAQHYLAKDSLLLALNGDGNNYGFLRVIDRYGDTKVGQTAKYCAGVIYIRLGQYRKGLDDLKEFHADDKIVQAEAYGLMGDAYMELGQTTEGIDWYEKAGHYNDNDLFSPLYLLRAGLALEKAGRPKEAIVIYQEIKTKYPESTEGREIDKYLARLGDVE